MSSDYKWQDNAACRGADPNQFVYQLPGEGELERLNRAAAAIEDHCTGCPVAMKCLQFAQDKFYSGVWGGVLLFGGNPQLLPGVATRPADPAPCGTYGGYLRHKADGSKVCRPCNSARLSEATRAYAGPCGTPNAYRNHYRRGEKPCEACRRAEALRPGRRAPKQPVG